MHIWLWMMYIVLCRDSFSATRAVEDVWCFVGYKLTNMIWSTWTIIGAMCWACEAKSPHPPRVIATLLLVMMRTSVLPWRIFCQQPGGNTAGKLRGTKVWVPTPGRLPKAELGVACGRGSLPPAVRVREYHPRKIGGNSDAKSCILVTTCCEISSFLKTTAKKLGGRYIVGPPT